MVHSSSATLQANEKTSLNVLHRHVGIVPQKLMARSHWRFSEASDSLALEVIYLDIFTLAIFPSNIYVYFNMLV